MKIDRMGPVGVLFMPIMSPNWIGLVKSPEIIATTISSKKVSTGSIMRRNTKPSNMRCANASQLGQYLWYRHSFLM